VYSFRRFVRILGWGIGPSQCFYVQRAGFEPTIPALERSKIYAP